MGLAIKHYKIYCQADGQWEHWYLPEGDAPPTTCPVNSGHAVDANSVVIVETISPQAATNKDNILYTTPHPASLLYEMCDRDILIRTATYDTRAVAVLAGVDANGTIAYAASTPGTYANYFSVEHTAGATGAGDENRALDAAFTPGTWDLVVTFGTDGNGDSVTPTANQVISMILAKVDPNTGFPVISPYIYPSATGDGTTNVQVVSKTQLAGGLSPSLSDVKVNTTDYTKSEWEEVQLVGVFKSDGNGGYVECADQTDADTNAVLSVWRYFAHNQTTKQPTVIEIRDGLMIVDDTITDSTEHQVYAVAAPLIPVALGGGVVQFDAYLKYYKGQVLGATSPQAKALDPTEVPAAAELRVHVYYPAGEKVTHVLRLVTYRPPGTF